MRKFTLVLSICFAALLASSASAQQIYGEYIESRNADVYTGHCFGNSEVNLMGDQAIVAWHVSKGEWQGVRLDGLNVVGVAKASGTLGAEYSNPFPARAVLIVDEKASPEQRDASLNYFGVDASQPLSVWRKKGWLHPDDPRGWFQWYCRYYMGRRMPEEDARQIRRWKQIERHVAQVKQNCDKGDLTCRKRQRQALLHWAYDSRRI